LAVSVGLLVATPASLCATEAQAQESAGAVRAAIRPHGGVPTMFINDQPVNAFIYSITGPGPRQLRHLPAFRDAGVHLYEVPLNFFECLAPDGTVNFAAVESGLRAVLAIDPEAWIIARLFMGTPGWWQERYPQELNEYAGAPPQPDGRVVRGPASMASEQWLGDTDDLLRRYLEFLEHSPLGRRVIGYHLCAGTTGEWHYDNFWWLPDTGPAMTKRFRAWLRGKYGDKPEFAAAVVPGAAERGEANDGLFRDPSTADRMVIDYYRCQQETVAQAILRFCRTTRQYAPDKLVGVFYGYYFHMGGRTLQAEGGHLAVLDVLKSPDVDFLCGPYSYEHHSRRVGGEGILRPLVETVKAHGKLYISESDSPTHLGCSQGNDLVARNLTDLTGSVAVMRRDFANVLTHGIGTWWFDVGPPDEQGGLAGGWWNTPELMAEMKRMREIGEEGLAGDRRSAAEVLVVCNPQTYYHVVCSGSGKDALTYPLLNDTARAIYHSGAPFDLIAATDLETVDLSPYKAVVFLDAFYLTAGQRKRIAQTVACDGRVVLWVYAPGYVDEEGLCVDRVSELTGMTVRRSADALAGRIEAVSGDHPLARSAVRGFGIDGPVSPVFWVDDPRATALGTISGTQKVGLAVREFDGWTSVYSFAPPICSEFLRAVFRKAGVHIYSDADDVLYVNRRFLAVNSEAGGLRTLHLPRPCDVVDAFSGKTVARNVSRFEVEIAPKSVQLYRLNDPKSGEVTQ